MAWPPRPHLDRRTGLARRWKLIAVAALFIPLLIAVAAGFAAGVNFGRGAQSSSSIPSHDSGPGLLFAGAAVIGSLVLFSRAIRRRVTRPVEELSDRLSSTGQSRRQLLADISHELRTPLTVLRSGLEAQLDGVHPRDDEHLDVLLAQTERLTRLVDDVHTLAIADEGRLSMHREPVLLSHIIEATLASARTQADDRDVKLSANIGPDVVIEIDPARMQQALTNLAANAIRHSPPGGRVLFASRSTHTEACVQVIDDGEGIPPDHLDDIFERFTKAADTGGSGLGLAIVRSIVAAHGGTVTASNRDDRQGAVFTIQIPAPG